jgi:acetolactate synthase I/II/III large subunit
MPTTVEVMVDGFAAAGTQFIAGVPGEQAALDIIETARKRGMRFILVKQETAGAMMSATWGEITGSLGVCLSTRGPGAASMVNGVAHAWLDRCPLIAITDRFASRSYLTGSHMRLDQMALYEPITKWNTVIDADSVRQQMRRAIVTATAEPPGPVHFDMPADGKSREVTEQVIDAPLIPDVVPVVPDRSALKAPLDLLKKSQRPILMVGLGALWSKASAELVAFAERLGAPVLVTAKCKGTIPEDHPLSAGCLRGGALERKLVAESDLIVAIGLDAAELHAEPWPYKATVLSLASVRSQDAEVPAAVEVVGNLKAVLEGLSQWSPEGSNWGERAARAFRQSVAAALDQPGTGKGLTPQRLFDVARATLPRNTVAAVDSGASHSIGAQKWLSYGPREFLASNGLSTMGYSVSAAMAARLAYPKERPVVAFSGDGGFLLAASELHTSVREKLPITVVVLDDGELGAMRVRQDLRGLQRYGTQLGGIDWEHLARGYGAEGVVVETENALGDALKSAVGSGKTTLIAARVDASGYLDQFKAMWGQHRDAK